MVNVVGLEPPFVPVTNLLPGERTASQLEVVADATRRDARTLDIQFTQMRLRQLSLPFVGALPDDAPQLAVPMRSFVGYIETTFLDDELRVARAPLTPLVRDDGVFVLVKRDG